MDICHYFIPKYQTCLTKSFTTSNYLLTRISQLINASTNSLVFMVRHIVVDACCPLQRTYTSTSSLYLVQYILSKV